MPFEKFDKKDRRGRSKTGPWVTITDQRFYFNKEAVEFMGDPDYLTYFWDPDTSQIGFKASANMKDYTLCKHVTASSHIACCVAFKKVNGLEGIRKSQLELVKKGELFVISLEEELT